MREKEKITNKDHLFFIEVNDEVSLFTINDKKLLEKSATPITASKFYNSNMITATQ